MTTAPPGWYQDPQTQGQQRYWDGQAWSAATAPGAASPPLGQQDALRPTSYSWVAIGSATTMLLATFMPWFTATVDPRAAPLPDKSIIGWESTAVILGVLLPLALSIAVCAVMVLQDMGSPTTQEKAIRWAPWLPWVSVLALVILLVPLWTGKDSKLEAIGPFADGSGYDIKRGVGLYLAASAAAVLVAVTVIRSLAGRREAM